MVVAYITVLYIPIYIYHIPTPITSGRIDFIIATHFAIMRLQFSSAIHSPNDTLDAFFYSCCSQTSSLFLHRLLTFSHTVRPVLILTFMLIYIRLILVYIQR